MVTTNLSKIKRDKMLKTINEIKKNIADEETLNNLSMIENELTKKKYGLIWEEHEERVDKELETQIPTFEEIKNKEIASDNDDKYNFLLEGDNLHSLYLLEKTHKEKIDLIYIDPPYNTGKNDFVYNDTCIDENDDYRHSKWLSFMEKRLKIAYTLMKPTGVIFISIDDNEYSQLKILCDEIFGESNFISTIIQNKMNAKNDTVNVQKNHEYILIYRKRTIFINNKVQPNLIKKEIIEKEVLKEQDRFYMIGDSITTRGEGGTLNARPNLGYSVYYNPKTKEKIGIADYDIELAKTSNDENFIYKDNIDLKEQGFIIIRPPKVRGQLGCWTWGIDKFNKEKDNIIITGTTGKYSVKKRTFVNNIDVIEKNGKYFYEKQQYTNSKSIIEFSTNEGSISLNKVMGSSGTFNNPKNLNMIKYFISLVPNKDLLVLDFFAGSGTTGQSVLELNKEDNGNRHFILCTNNENEICEKITYRRLSKVIKGYANEQGIETNLKYYKTTYIPKINTEEENLHNNLLINIKNLIQLENGISIDDNVIRVYLNEEELDDFSKNKIALDNCNKLYISSDILLTSIQEEIFKNNNIEVYIIPEYYFKDEILEVA